MSTSNRQRKANNKYKNKNRGAFEYGPLAMAISKIPAPIQFLMLAAIVLVCVLKPDWVEKAKSILTADTPGYSTGYIQSDVKPFERVNNNIPKFTKDEISDEGYIELSELDSLGRCQEALACVGPETMPTEKRGEIGSVKPTGWHAVKYPSLIKDRYLYNRCHLIGFQLSGLNAEKRNLITGTRYLNVEGMLPFENEIADYVKETGNHVMYRVTPNFVGSELVARGLYMEAMSVEDKGKGVSFSIYCPNIQPGIMIDYGNGDSVVEETGEKGTEH